VEKIGIVRLGEFMKKKKYIYFIAVSVFIIMLNIFLMFNQKEVLENIDVAIEKNEMAFIVDGEVQTTVPAKGSGDYDITANCTNGNASWDYDNWGIVINTIDEGNIKCDIEFNEKGTLRIASDIAATDVFLNGPLIKNTIESIEFTTSKTVPSEALGSWDVSEKQNGTIMAWYFDRNSNGRYEVYIGENGGVVANSDSSYLFQNLTYLSTINLSNLDISNVTNMSSMFAYTGYNRTVGSNFYLDLGNQFDTSNVTNMASMFDSTGYNNQGFTLNLGKKFDTSNVTDMFSMFASTGYHSAYFELNLGDKFDTSKVENMSSMFAVVGGNRTNFKLDLGDKFDTSKVTNMQQMFSHVGYSSTVFTLNLGDKFDTSSVTNMQNMFALAGLSNKSFTLDLGDKFDTTKVTNMEGMFISTGRDSTTFTLNLRDKFDTSNVTNMYRMFNATGLSSTVFTLDLGDKFDTSNVTTMEYMFSDTGYSSTVFTLNLGDKFDTSSVTNMSDMFSFTGYSNPNFTIDLRTFNFERVSRSNDMFYNSKATHIVYVKNASDKSWVSDKDFNGSIIDCSSNICP